MRKLWIGLQFLFVVFGIISFASCSDDDELTSQSGEETIAIQGLSENSVDGKIAIPVEETPPSAQISFKNQILPVIESSCARCHTGNGPGATHVLFETVLRMCPAYAFAVAAVVESEIMPPWPASDLSLDFLHDWSLSQQDKKAIVDWTRSGSAIDIDPSTRVIATDGINLLVDYDQELFPIGNYDGGKKDKTDEYRLFSSMTQS